MNQESGRSLVEIIGVLAIGAIMIASAYSIYQAINNRQTRLIASETFKDVATKTKTLYEFSGYDDVSITQLIADGVLQNDKAPIGTKWSIDPGDGGTTFSIEVTGLTNDDCDYFAIKKADWAHKKITKCDGNKSRVIFIIK